ncbi:hypothetical protein IAD21_00231 [Abditibacteriota bacterium]|nr:hypothetical protein IAD21_00231 [Abditibacteriota bacterium]
MRRVFSASGLLLLMLTTGCTRNEMTLGRSQQTPNPKIVLVSSLNAHNTSSARAVAPTRGTNRVVTLHGTMIEKCPIAGCWFVLRDKTGTIRVDTKAAGFSVSAIALQTPVTVSGTVAESDGVKTLVATGLSY